MTKKKKRRRVVWIVLLIIALAVAALLLFGPKKSAGVYAQEVAAVRDIETFYSFSGNLAPVSDETQTAKETLKVRELLAREGDAVRAGDPLLRAADGTRVYAAHDGVLETLYLEADDTLAIGAKLARIVDYDALEVDVDVDEYDVSALSVGKAGAVYVNAVDEAFAGAVTDIAREATVTGGVSYYAVTFSIAADARLRAGMSAEVRVPSGAAMGVVTLPVKALQYDAANKPYVLVKGENGRYTPREITLGLSDGAHVEIASGLSAGTTVYYAQNDMLRFYQQFSGGRLGGGNAP